MAALDTVKTQSDGESYFEGLPLKVQSCTLKLIYYFESIPMIPAGIGLPQQHIPTLYMKILVFL